MKASTLILPTIAVCAVAIQPSFAADRVKTANGILESTDAARIFERFYRAGEARSRQDGGFGLGLAIVRWIAESHRGSVTCTSELGRGSTFTVTLPK